jgi:hypothetical protein
MAVRQAETDETGLNMTPMIDIVFQLIIFFMLNMRFRAADSRIDSVLPRKVGPQPTPTLAEDEHRVRATLVRLDAVDPAAARTKVKIGGREWILPAGDVLADAQRSPEYARQRAAVLASIESHLGALRSGGLDKGEIDAPPPSGPLVPHADAVAVLDSFLASQFKDVAFQGARSPLPRR